MGKSMWPASFRMDPGMSVQGVLQAIRQTRWDAKEWHALRVVASLDDERSKTPVSYAAYLSRSRAQFWAPEHVLFWQLIITTHNFYKEHQPGPGSF